MTTMLDFPEALEAAGVNVRVLDTWELIDPAGYVWREHDGDPAGHMHHHTASASYKPNTTKANGYAGMSKHDSERLYQEDYGDSVPVYTIANAYPAPVSSGAGDVSVLHRVRKGIEVVGRQGSDTPGWYGNTHYWNTEWVLDGIGSPIEQAVWDMMLVVCQVQNELMNWTNYHHIAHGHHTRRKVDLWGGQFSDTNRDGFTKTVEALRKDMEVEMAMSLERYATRWRNPLDFDRAVVKGILTPDEAKYWKKVSVKSDEWQDLRDAVTVRVPLWGAGPNDELPE
jgi:hypothetical protein